MRISLLAALVWGSAVGPVQAQVPTRQSSERRAQLRADSVRRLREQREDSLRRVSNPTEARRLKEEQRRDLQDARDQVRRRVPPAERSQRPAPARALEPRAARDSLPALTPSLARGDSTPLLVISPEQLVARDTSALVPPVSKPRGFVMRRTARPGAPAYCQSGAGHPLYGREWCFERGFRLGAEWVRARVRGTVPRPPSGAAVLDRAALEEHFGEEIADLIDAARDDLELDDSVSVRWISTPAGGSRLHFQVGSVQIAELVDRNRDGRADAIWIARRPE